MVAGWEMSREVPYTLQGLREEHGQYPDDYIPFSNDDELWLPYSAKAVCGAALLPDHLLHDQLKAYHTYMVKPPLGGHGPMAGVDQDTAEMRTKSMAQVVGFCTSKLSMAPSLGVLLDPVAMAVVCGFWRARGLSPMTIKLRVQHITQGVPFVTSRYCPKERGHSGWSQDHINQTQAWYKKLNAKALAEAERAPKKEYNVGLWEAWEFARKDYVAFLLELKVRIHCVVCCPGGVFDKRHTIVCRPTTTNGPQPWHRGAKLWCSGCCCVASTKPPSALGPCGFS